MMMDCRCKGAGGHAILLADAASVEAVMIVGMEMKMRCSI